MEIPEEDAFFDAILCTEVLEHIPYPEKAIAEFARLLRPGGVLVLTVPASCLRHFDPYYFYSGFSDRWINKVLNDRGFDVRVVEPVGDYFGWIAAELARTASRNSIFSKILIAPALAYFLLRKKTHASVSTLCMGYHVVANKRIEVVN